MLNVHISGAGLELIKRFEGFRTHTYLDVAGFPTIGYGHLIKLGESFPHGVTETEATDLLTQDVRATEQAVERLVKVPLTQGRFDALVSWTFNLGSGRLASSTMLKCLNAGRYDEAVEQLLTWVNAGGHPQAGLVTRRQAEAALWRVSA